MQDLHLSGIDLDRYIEGELESTERPAIEEHLANCPMCRGRVARDQRIERALQELPRVDAPRDLSARIIAAVDVRLAEEQAHRQRLPFVVGATLFSALLMLWFGLQMLVAFQEGGALDFLSLIANHPDIFSAYWSELSLALLESLPLPEILLTLFATLTVVVLAIQWVETVRPQVPAFRNNRL